MMKTLYEIMTFGETIFQKQYKLINIQNLFYLGYSICLCTHVTKKRTLLHSLVYCTETNF